MTATVTAFSLSAAVPLMITRSRLPLAVYLEVVAQLQQIEGIEVELLPQSALEFDYLQSQVGGLVINCRSVSEIDQAQVVAILNYYERRQGAWTILSNTLC